MLCALDWSSCYRQKQAYLSQKHLPNNTLRIVNLQPSLWDKTTAKLVAQWTKTINKRRFPKRLRRSMVKQSVSRNNSTCHPTRSKTEDISASARRYSAHGGEPPPVGSDVCKEDINQAYVRIHHRNSPGPGSARDNDPMDQRREGVAARLPGNSPEEQKGGKRRTPEDCIAHRKAIIIEKMMDIFQRWLDKRLAIMSYTIEAAEASEAADDPGCGGGSGTTGSGTEGSGDRDSNSEGSGDQDRRPKRQLPEDNDPGNSPGGGDDNGRDRGGNKRVKKRPDSEGVKFACPFHKHNPSAHKKKGCMSGSWQSIHRLKEHLYRVHLLPKFKCPRCNLGCASDRELEDHLRADEPCKKSNVVREEGIDPDTERKLRERKRHNSDQTEAQRWIEIYILLFPAADKNVIPSPYFDYDGTNTARCSRENLRRVKKKIKTDLPRVFKQELERRLGKMEHHLLKDVPDLLRHSIAQVFNDMPGDDTNSPTTSRGTSRATTPVPSPKEEPPSALSHEGEFDPEIDLSPYFTFDGDGGCNFFNFGPLGALDNIQQELENGQDVPDVDKFYSDSGYESSFTHGTCLQ